jgi:hypothetical protein
MAALTRGFVRAVADAPAFDRFGSGGSRLRSHADDADPAFARLAGMERLLAVLEALEAAPPLYLGGFLLENRDDTPWHTTGLPGEGPETVRVSVTLDSTRDGQGSLSVIAGSHHAAFNRALFEAYGYLDGEGTRLRLPESGAPGAVGFDSERGDVVIWRTSLWHAAFRRADERPRRGIYLTYIADPGSDPIRAEKLRRTCRSLVTVRRPYVYGGTLREHGGPSVEAMARRLVALGVDNVWPFET